MYREVKGGQECHGFIENQPHFKSDNLDSKCVIWIWKVVGVYL